MPAYNDGTTSIPVRAAAQQFPAYSFGSNTSPTGSGTEAGDAIPSVATAGLQFAIPHTVNGMTPQDRTVTMRVLFPAGAPGAVSISLQLSMRDVDAEYFSEATTTNVNGDEIVLRGVQSNFVRAKLNSATPNGKTFVVKFLVS